MWSDFVTKVWMITARGLQIPQKNRLFLRRFYSYMVENYELWHTFSMTPTGVLIRPDQFKNSMDVFRRPQNVYVHNFRPEFP